MEGKEFWIISVPLNAREDTFGELNRKILTERELSHENYKFEVPTLRVGTLDSLMSLSDDLIKIDSSMENTVRKIGKQYWELAENKPERREILISGTGGTTNADTYIAKFKWEDARYSRRKSLRELTDELKMQVGKIDDELKQKAADYQQINQEINAAEKKESGSLMVRDLNSVLTPEDILETDFLTTLVIVIPKTETKEFLSSYETLSEFILPRSAKQISEDGEHALFTINLFKVVVEDFKIKARDVRWTVRKYEAVPKDKKDTQDLISKRERLRPVLTRWCQLHFGEVFIAWVHLKVIRTFVESVLRFGLPANFQAMLILPRKRSIKRLRDVLNEMYAHLGSGDQETENADEMDQAFIATAALLGTPAHFYPYVYLELNLDIWN